MQLQKSGLLDDVAFCLLCIPIAVTVYWMDAGVVDGGSKSQGQSVGLGGETNYKNKLMGNIKYIDGWISKNKLKEQHRSTVYKNSYTIKKMTVGRQIKKTIGLYEM